MSAANAQREAKIREAMQRAILRVLDANHSRYGLDLDAVTLWTSLEGFQGLESGVVDVELQYLQGKGLVEEISKSIEPANRLWKRTAAGRDFLSVN